MPAAKEKPKGERGLFVRIPADEAAKLDRAAFELKLTKQELITGLLERHVDPTSARSLAALRQMGEGAGGAADGGRRVVVEAGAEGLTVGRADFLALAEPEVMTLVEAAGLLRVEESVLRELAEDGELPGRRVGADWRFSRRALLDWLGGKRG
jgi:excisionase family DNA binding protein